MLFNIDTNLKVEVTAKAQNVPVDCRTFIIENTGETPVYIHNKDDGKAATVEDFCIPAGEMLNIPMSCETLSVIAEEKGEIRLLFGSVWR